MAASSTPWGSSSSRGPHLEAASTVSKLSQFKRGRLQWDWKKSIAKIQSRLREGQLPDEAAVSTGVVLPVLQELGWPVFEPSVVFPQYQVEGRRVDYALCNSNGQPVVFIEVKRVGMAAAGERQLFEYAFHKGVPLLVLTDGQEWSFYLPYGQGGYQDRRVYKLDIQERNAAECCHRLQRYLSRDNVLEGDAFEYAREDHEAADRQRQIEQTLPLAFGRLLEEADDSLVNSLAAKVSDICGYEPDAATCAKFLLTKSSLVLGQARVSAKNDGQGQLHTSLATQVPTPDSVGFYLHDQWYQCQNNIDVMRSVFQTLAKRDPSFPERFADPKRKHGRKRRYLARTKDELYPDQPALCERASTELNFGWFMGTNHGQPGITAIVRLACEVAGLKLGTDLVIHLRSR